MSKADLANRIKKADDQYRAKLPGKIEEITSLWDHLRYVQWSHKHLDKCYRQVHVLLGGAGTLGYTQLYDSLKQLDDALRPFTDTQQPPDAAILKRIETALQAVLKQSATFNEQAATVIGSDDVSDAQGAHREELVFLVDDDQVVLDVLGAQLQEAGFQVRVFDSLAKLYTALKEQTPSLIVLDIVFPQGALAGVDALQSLRIKAGFQVPVIFISARSDIVARLKALRAGGNAFMAKPVDIKELTKTAHSLIANDRRYRVLLVDDDPVCLLTHENYLTRANCQVKSVTNPLEVLKQIKQFHPDVVFLDLMMPNCNGVEIAQILRQEQTTHFLPIVFLTGSDDPADIKNIEKISHSSYLAKPVEPEHITHAALAAAREYQFFKNKLAELEQASVSPSLVSRYEFYGRLDELIGLPETEREHYALLYLAPEQLVSDDAELLQVGMREHQALQRTLTATLAQDDLVAALSEGVFVVLKDFAKQAPVNFVKQTIAKLDNLKLAANGSDTVMRYCAGVLLLKGIRGRVAQLMEQTEKAAALSAQEDDDPWHIVNLPEPRENESQRETEKTPGKERRKETPAQHSDIQAALDEKKFFLQFQPIVNVSDPSFDAYEVLVRLHGMKDHDYSPEQFLPVLEKSSGLKELDRWVFTHAIKAMQQDQQAYLNSILFLKVSAVSLKYKVTVPVVSNLLRESRIKGGRRLVFLFSHQQILDDVEGHLLFARQLRAIDCGVAVEHFSLDGADRYIEKLAPDFIKIDAELIKRAAKSSEQKAALGEFVTKQSAQGVTVIAATVEEVSVMQHCYTWGIKYFQGYAIQIPGDAMHRAFDFEDG